MKMWKVYIPVAAILLLAGQAAAQTDEDERMRALEARELEMEEKLRSAEERMAEAAREIAEISKERLPRMEEIEQRFAMSSKPRLGVTIETMGEDGAVEGVQIAGVTPGSAASDAGLRPGDILTSVNAESLSADSAKAANMRLLDFLKGVEEGDVLKVEYLRAGKVGSVEVEPRVVVDRSFVWVDKDGPRHFNVPPAPSAPGVHENFKMEFAFPWVGSGFGDLELVELNKGLGRYFGTEKGLLVVSAPESDSLELRDGDVIQSIDGREPKDVRHALRILGSYQAGEKLKLGIMRDKKKVTLNVEIPADQHGNLQNDFHFDVSPAIAPVPEVDAVAAPPAQAAAPLPEART